MNLNTLKSAVFCLCVTALLSSCQTTGPEVTDPPQKQASAIKKPRRSLQSGQSL